MKETPEQEGARLKREGVGLSNLVFYCSDENLPSYFPQEGDNHNRLLNGWLAESNFNTEARGIKTHDGRCMAAEQKLLVQHILDTDEGLSENSRKILEELIK